jgi:hypothetical protein
MHFKSGLGRKEPERAGSSSASLKTAEAATLPGVRIPLPPPFGLDPVQWTTFYDKGARWMVVECSLSNSFGVR